MTHRAANHRQAPSVADFDRALLRIFHDNAQEYAAFRVDRRGRIVKWNAAARRLFGYAASQIVGRPLNLLYPRGGNSNRFRDCLRGNARGARCEGWWIRKNRSQFWGECVCTAVKDDADVIAGFAVVIRDLTASTQADEDRRVLASIVENSEDAIIGKDLNGIILKWNLGAQRLFGYRASEMIGKSMKVLMPPDRFAKERAILNRLRHGDRIQHYETVRLRKDGQLIDVSMSVSPIRGPDGRIIGASKIMRDITERKRSEALHRQDEQILRGILDTASDAIIAIDERGIIQSVNVATERLFGYPSAELLGVNVNLLMPEPFHGEHDGYIRAYCRTGQAKIIGIGREVTGLRRNGTTFPMHLAVSEVKLRDRRIFTGIVHDLTERRRLERQIMETAANEQRRIGQDLHDGLCQDLVGIAFSIDAVVRTLPADSEQKQLSKLASAVREAAGQARRLAHGLNPVDLKAGGLAVALENLAAKVSDSFHVHCAFRWDHLAQTRNDATATHLYRIAQEAVGNAIRHGKANEVQISFIEKHGSVVLIVADNGKGMTESISDTVKKGLVLSGPKNAPPAGMGLQTMHYRARVMGGTFSVAPRRGGGTTVICQVGREQSFHDGKIPERPSEKIRPGKRRPSR